MINFIRHKQKSLNDATKFCRHDAFVQSKIDFVRLNVNEKRCKEKMYQYVSMIQSLQVSDYT